MIIGYARVSTLDQNPDLQIDALKEAGCEKIYTDKASGSVADRPELMKMKDSLRKGDTLVIWKLARLARSLKNLIQWIEFLNENDIQLIVIQMNINTSTPAGRLFFHIFGALDEFQLDLIRENTTAGLAAARARGRVGGRPPKLSAKKVKRLKQIYDKKEMSVKEICEWAGIGKTTFYKYIRAL